MSYEIFFSIIVTANLSLFLCSLFNIAFLPPQTSTLSEDDSSFYTEGSIYLYAESEICIFQLTVSTYLHYHEYCSLRNHFASIVFW
jgi:hypothetical protein